MKTKAPVSKVNYDDLGYDSPKDQSKHSITNDYEVQPVYFIRNAVYKDDFGWSLQQMKQIKDDKASSWQNKEPKTDKIY